jgi:hypothetical protein
LILILPSLVACTGIGKPPQRPNVSVWPEFRADYRVETLRASLRDTRLPSLPA